MLKFSQFNEGKKAIIPEYIKTEVVENNIHFKTGKPVTFTYARNPVSSKQFFTKNSEMYQQNIEPSGRYMTHATHKVPQGWEHGEITFRNPLVIYLNTSGHVAYDNQSWKYHLSKIFGSKGRNLTKLIKNAGYDGIITVHPNQKETSEILDLR